MNECGREERAEQYLSNRIEIFGKETTLSLVEKEN
jgi:hypothetical protein